MGTVALNQNGAKNYFGVRKASAEDVYYIAHGCARRRSDNSDFFGVRRQRLFVMFGKKPFLLKLFFKLLIRKVESTDTVGLHIVNIQLILP